MEKNLLLYNIIFILFGFSAVSEGATDKSSSVISIPSGAPLQPCEEVLIAVYSYQLRSATVMSEILSTLKELMLDAELINQLDIHEQQRLEDIQTIWQRRTGHSLSQQDVVIMLSQQSFIQNNVRWRRSEFNDPVAESKAISPELFLTVLEYVLEGEDHAIVNFVAYDPPVDAAKIINEAMTVLEVWAQDIEAFDRLPVVEKKKIVDLDNFFQKQKGQSLFTQEVAARLLSRQAGSLKAKPFQKLQRDETIASAKFISEDLFMAALEYVKSPETFYGKSAH